MEEANSSFTFYNVWGLTKVLWGNWCSISSGLLSLGSINNICSQLPLLSLRDLKIAQPYGFNSTFLECLYLSRLPSKFPTKTSIVQTVEVWDLWGHEQGWGLAGTSGVCLWEAGECREEDGCGPGPHGHWPLVPGSQWRVVASVWLWRPTGLLRSCVIRSWFHFRSFSFPGVSTHLEVAVKRVGDNVCKVLANVWQRVNNQGMFAIVNISYKSEFPL